MATPMSSLLEEVSREHFPYPPAAPEELDAFEHWVGWKLDPDLRAFYLRSTGPPHRPLSFSEGQPISHLVERSAVATADGSIE
jgi:hypothetical protein